MCHEVRKSIYLKTGGFDRRLNAQEDSQLSFRVAKLGKIKLIYNTPVIFSGRRFKDGFMKGNMQYASTFIQLFLFRKKGHFIGYKVIFSA